MATLTSGDFPVGTNYWRWPSRNLPIARACAISSPACALYKASCITWGFRGNVSRSTLADANESHDWRIFAEFAQVLIGIARPLHAHDPIGVDLDQVCMLWIRRPSICACRYFRGRSFVGARPPSKCTLCWTEAISIFRDSSSSHLSSAFFVVRTRSNVLIQRRYSHRVDKRTGVRSDQTVILTSFESASAYPGALRRVSCLDKETQERHLPWRRATLNYRRAGQYCNYEER
jgi:hypothetical protein